MDYKIVKVPNKECYTVMRGKVVAMKCVSLANAKKGVKMLNMLDFRASGNRKMN